MFVCLFVCVLFLILCIYLGSISFPEAVCHARVHLGPIRGNLLVLQPCLHQVKGKDAGHADDAGDPPVDDLGEEGELLGGLLGHDGPLLPDGRHVQDLMVEVSMEDLFREICWKNYLLDLLALSH